MKKHYRFILIIGIIILILPLLGFPNSWKVTIQFLSGLLLVILALLERYFIKMHQKDFDEPIFEESDGVDPADAVFEEEKVFDDEQDISDDYQEEKEEERI